MKLILLFILATVISFFVWNILRRLFMGNSNRPDFKYTQNPKQKASEKISQKVKWDAETVDFEEIQEKPKAKKH